MRQLLISILSLSFSCGIAFSQDNLVPNYSFEELMNDSCILSNTNFNTAIKNWFVSNRTPDIYNVCDNTFGFGNYGIPSNYTGFQYPLDGQGYIGLFSFNLGANYSTSNTNGNVREWVGIKLNQPLTHNGIYCIKYSVNLSNSSKVSTLPPQFFFSSDSLIIAQNTYPNFMNFQNNYLAVLSNEIIFDTISWTRISGNYIAKGDERYVYIGNFYDHQNTAWDTLNSPLPYGGSTYFYVDSVSIVKCGLSEIGENIAHKNAVKIYPNPATNSVSISMPTKYPNPQLFIYNLTGQLVATKPVQPNQPVPITELNAGVYIYAIQSNNTLIGREKVVVY